jgi:hypothetical protein
MVAVRDFFPVSAEDPQLWRFGGQIGASWTDRQKNSSLH